jgi:hypothetical protein
MQLTRCPVCHARIGLDQLIQDEAGRELLALVARMPDWLAAPLVSYLGLFRPATRDLANDRAFRLAREVLELSGEQQLAQALTDTVQAMRVKQDQGGFKPLSNHNYLKQVLESVSTRGTTGTSLMPVQGGAAPMGSRSKTAQTIDMLANYPTPLGIDEWFTRTVCGSLAELMIMGLDNVPAADTMPLVVGRFLTELWPKRQWRQESHLHGARRLRSAFMLAAEAKRWPSSRDVLAHVPTV